MNIENTETYKIETLWRDWDKLYFTFNNNILVEFVSLGNLAKPKDFLPEVKIHSLMNASQIFVNIIKFDLLPQST